MFSVIFNTTVIIIIIIIIILFTLLLHRQNGNGYGDGRAISVGEVVTPTGRWELQLKGGGTTPFCRSGDGRAVLRSSVREFLASEAMHNLGVSTTRALSLIVSGSETVMRPWYSANLDRAQLPSMDDPRLAGYPPQLKRRLIAQLAQQVLFLNSSFFFF